MVNVPSKSSVCEDADVNFTLASTSVCNSDIAVDTVEADVPIAPDVIVPSSASCSFIAAVRLLAEVVKLILPISDSCSLTAVTTVVAVVFNALAFPTSPLNELMAFTISPFGLGMPDAIAVISPISSCTSLIASITLPDTIFITSDPLAPLFNSINSPSVFATAVRAP